MVSWKQYLSVLEANHISSDKMNNINQSMIFFLACIFMVGMYIGLLTCNRKRKIRRLVSHFRELFFSTSHCPQQPRSATGIRFTQLVYDAPYTLHTSQVDENHFEPGSWDYNVLGSINFHSLSWTSQKRAKHHTVGIYYKVQCCR